VSKHPIRMIGKNTYLIDSKRLVVINNPHLDRIRQIQNTALLNLQHILNRQANLDTIALIMCPKYDLLDTPRPLLRARRTVRLEQILSLIRSDGEAGLFFSLLCRLDYFGGYCVLQVDSIARKVQFGGVGVVCEDVAAEDEPVAVEL